MQNLHDIMRVAEYRVIALAVLARALQSIRRFCSHAVWASWTVGHSPTPKGNRYPPSAEVAGRRVKPAGQDSAGPALAGLGGLALVTRALGKEWRWAASATVDHEQASVYALSTNAPLHSHGDLWVMSSSWTEPARILRTATGWAPSESTLLRHFHRCELMGPAAGGAAARTVALSPRAFSAARAPAP